jgi:hypothetical protein
MVVKSLLLASAGCALYALVTAYRDLVEQGRRGESRARSHQKRIARLEHMVGQLARVRADAPARDPLESEEAAEPEQDQEPEQEPEQDQEQVPEPDWRRLNFGCCSGEFVAEPEQEQEQEPEPEPEQEQEPPSGPAPKRPIRQCCHFCGAPGTNRVTCPHNPAASHPAPSRHRAQPLPEAGRP